MIDERSYREILAEAKEKFPRSAFLRKCAQFYEENRFLSERQIEKLDGLPTVKSRNPELKLFTSREEIVADMLSRGFNQQDIDSGLFDDIIDEAEEEIYDTFESWKDT